MKEQHLIKEKRVVLPDRRYKKVVAPKEKRSVQSIPASIQPEEVGTLAQRKRLTVLETKCVSSEVKMQYDSYFQQLVGFWKESGFHWPPELDNIDPLLADFMDVLFLEKRSPHEGEKICAAVEFNMFEMRGKLLRTKRCLKGWRKVVPSQSRLPLPRLVMYGIAMQLAAQGNLQMALKTVVDFILYLRPGEGIDIRKRNVVSPVASAGPQFRWVTIVIRDIEG